MKKIFQKKGFTLLEIIIVMSIFIIAVLIVLEYVIQGYNANRFSIEMADAIEYAKKGIETMTKETREASFADNGDYPIAEANAQSFAFYGDIDKDFAVEKVRYYLDGAKLVKSIIEPTADNPPQYLANNEATTTISMYVRNGADPIFYYYNGDYPIDTVNNPLVAPVNINNIRLLRLFLKININPNRAPSNFILEIFVTLRNLKDNL